MIRWVALLVALLMLCGCPPRVQTIAAETVEAAVSANNEMVAAMEGLQARFKARRKAAMVEAANTVGSYAEGQAALDEIEERYAPAFEVFAEAEHIQAAIAGGLELAREALKRGEVPNTADLMVLYVQLQGLYARLSKELAEQ